MGTPAWRCDGGSDAGGMIQVRVYKLAKGLTREEALRRVRRLDHGRDYRGFTYNRHTGYATVL